MEFWKQLCAEHGINPGGFTWCCMAILLMPAYLLMAVGHLNHKLVFPLNILKKRRSVLILISGCPNERVVRVSTLRDTILKPLPSPHPPNYEFLFCMAEGILEDFVVEGIDRKDVFFYQVCYYLWAGRRGR
jgi:hypothetical protein